MNTTSQLRYAEISARYFAATGRTPSDDGFVFKDSPSTLDLANFFAKIFKQPPEKTIAMFAAKGITATWSWDDLDKAAHSESFTAAKVMNADVLQLIRDSIDKALKEGTDFEEWKQAVVVELQSAGWYGKQEVVDPETGKTGSVDLSAGSRLRTIYNTNMQSSYMNSRWDQMQQTADRRPYMQYLAVIDSNTTPTCEGLNGQVIEMGTGARIPPLHYNCRTRIRSLGDRELGRFKLSVAPTSILTEFPPSQGFDSPPDKKWSPEMDKYDPDIRAKLKQELKKK